MALFVVIAISISGVGTGSNYFQSTAQKQQQLQFVVIEELARFFNERSLSRKSGAHMNDQMPKVAIILGSTRPGRNGEAVSRLDI